MFLFSRIHSKTTNKISRRREKCKVTLGKMIISHKRLDEERRFGFDRDGETVGKSLKNKISQIVHTRSASLSPALIYIFGNFFVFFFLGGHVCDEKNMSTKLI